MVNVGWKEKAAMQSQSNIESIKVMFIIPVNVIVYCERQETERWVVGRKRQPRHIVIIIIIYHVMFIDVTHQVAPPVTQYVCHQVTLLFIWILHVVFLMS